jgi:hypothetical protein
VVPPDVASDPHHHAVPLADRPPAAGIPGGTTPVRLVDDDLAASLNAGSRLGHTLSAIDFATSPEVDPGGQVRSATCLAVDRTC